MSDESTNQLGTKWMIAVSLTIVLAVGVYALLSRDDYPKPAEATINTELPVTTPLPIEE